MPCVCTQKMLPSFIPHQSVLVEPLSAISIISLHFWQRYGFSNKYLLFVHFISGRLYHYKRKPALYFVHRPMHNTASRHALHCTARCTTLHCPVHKTGQASLRMFFLGYFPSRAFFPNSGSIFSNAVAPKVAAQHIITQMKK